MIKNLKCLLWFLLIFIQGCSDTHDPKDDVKGICISCVPYFVRGSWHYPQRHYNYKKKGLASWYGPGFHGKPKASGEKYNQNALTAAHKTLPLPTVACVKNRKNGKSVVVVIDDRGPFVYKGRIIDLSKAAAQEIGTYEKGIGEVDVCALVDQSQALSKYIACHGTKKRTWREIYDEEIAP